MSAPLNDSPVSKKRRWLRWLIEIVVILALLAGIRAWQQRGMVVGEAPDFEQIALNGERVHLDDYRGKPVLLHFWASWCPLCKFEQESISNLAKDWRVITVAFQSGTEADIQEYMQANNITDWITLSDKEGKLAEQYGVRGVPSTYVVDSEGNIRFKEIGLTSSWGLKLRLFFTEWFYAGDA